jgi:hypothetical protein
MSTRLDSCARHWRTSSTRPRKANVCRPVGRLSCAVSPSTAGRRSYSFRDFTFGLIPDKGSHDLRVRAWNRSGQSQPMEALWQPAEYIRNVVESIKVIAA